MSIDRIRELLKIMETHDLAEIEVEEGDSKVRLRKQEGGLLPPGMHAPPSAATPGFPSAKGQAGKEAGTDATALIPIKSPIVGTFYKAPAPDAEPFVRVGTAIQNSTIVCIVEAMKVMNEVKAGIGGMIAEVLVENGEAVEYGQPLFLVKTA
ncbi:MAG: acetyl-CoA carboxylase biotin carboxyl carrier protein [Planctomycetota bacterium]